MPSPQPSPTGEGVKSRPGKAKPPPGFNPAQAARDGLSRDGLSRDGLSRDGLSREIKTAPAVYRSS